jgi:hypothetical protein
MNSRRIRTKLALGAVLGLAAALDAQVHKAHP